MMIKSIILVGLGGGLGSIFRYLTALLVNKHFSSLYPLATFMANLIGCFLIGLLLGLFERHHWTGADLKFLFIIGFCGGYTTFSTFTMENIILLQTNQTLAAFGYIALSVVAGLMATWLGLFVVR